LEPSASPLPGGHAAHSAIRPSGHSEGAAAERHHLAPLERAAELRELGRLDEAETVCRDILTDSPDNVSALVQLGHCAQQRGDHATALARFQAAAAANPDNPWPHVYVGNELRETGHLEEAEAAYRRAGTEGPGGFHALMGLGHCAQLRHNHAEAATRFQEAAAANPGDPWPHLYTGDAFRELGRFGDAETAYRRAGAAGPAGFHALMGLGHCAQLRADHATALAHFKVAASAGPQDPWPRIYIGNELRALRRLDEAEAVYRSLLAEYPRNQHATLGLALIARAWSRRRRCHAVRGSSANRFRFCAGVA
jgi:tetratricopeptide (TPR) repeat protein